MDQQNTLKQLKHGLTLELGKHALQLRTFTAACDFSTIEVNSWTPGISCPGAPNLDGLKVAQKSIEFQATYTCIHMYHVSVYMDVSENNGTSKSSILIRFSIVNHPFGVPLFLETPIQSL